jgi:4-oxalocrotonate tautomerase
MPVATVQVIEGVFSNEQKQEMIEKITEAMVEVEGEGMRDVTWVIMEEVKQGDWAIGGKFPKPKAKSS